MSDAARAPVVRPLAESGLLIELGDAIDDAVSARVAALAMALQAAGLPGVSDVVPSFTALMVLFDPQETDGDAIETSARDLLTGLGGEAATPTRTITIPVAYGGDHGPDLPDVAAHTGLDPATVVNLHTAAEYRVACMGFAPGFAYLSGLPPELATPRRANPRTHVPIGSVGIGGVQTGIYPLTTPGGWNVIGRTPLRMFDLTRPEPFLLQPGDRLEFRRISLREYDQLAQSLASATDSAATANASERGAITAARSIRVVEPGLLTTVQDLGRPGLMRFGVSPGGALDRAALILGNRLVGNRPDAAGLEITLVGPRLRFGGPTIIALTGADLAASLNGAAPPLWTPIAVAADDELSFAPTSRSSGARAYLCLAGGIAVEPVMGSRSTDLFGGFGGIDGRPLRRGNALPLGEASAAPAELLRRRLAGPPPSSDPAAPVQVVLGPQAERFTDDGIATFLDSDFAVSAKSDRMGMRLIGPAIAHSSGADLISEGIAHGAIQVPGDGQPILLLAARQTVGGYPKIATVTGADLDRLGQRRPTDRVRFAEVDVATARALTLAYRANLGAGAVVIESGVAAGWSPAKAAPAEFGEGKTEQVGAEWSPAGVAALVAALRTAEVTHFRLELDVPRLMLEIRRGANVEDDRPSLLGQPAQSSSTEATLTTPSATVTAPLLGVFYRRPGPDKPPYVEVGDSVAAGAAVGVIEVMKTYHEVVAPWSGTVSALLVDDGSFVEFGQALLRIDPAEPNAPPG